MRNIKNTYTDPHYVDGEKVEYDILLGNERLVFIKVGARGSIRGRRNKYRKMAERVHQRIGATVICASNPDTPHGDLDEKEIRRVIAEMGLSDFEISFVGASDGAYHNLALAKRFPETKKIIGINPSYITPFDLQERLIALAGVFKVLIFGTKDEDFREIEPTLRRLEGNTLKLIFVHGADHSFTGMEREFYSLSDHLAP